MQDKKYDVTKIYGIKQTETFNKRILNPHEPNLQQRINTAGSIWKYMQIGKGKITDYASNEQEDHHIWYSHHEFSDQPIKPKLQPWNDQYQLTKNSNNRPV